MTLPNSKITLVNDANLCSENEITAKKKVEIMNSLTDDDDDACEDCLYEVKECRKRQYNERGDAKPVFPKEIKTDFTIPWKTDNCPYLYNNHNYARLPVVPQRFKNMKTEVLMSSLFFACFCEKWYNGTRKLILRGADLMPRIGRRFQDWDVPYLMVFLRANKDVVSLNLAYNNIHSAGFINLIDYITAYEHILELNVQNNEIGTPGIDHLCQNGDKIPLKALRLNGNKFGTESSKKMALLLLKNSRLRYLDVAEVDQTASSLVYFTTVMRWDQEKCNQTLKILDISRPNPGYMYTFDSTHFASVIGCMLRFNRCLVELHLQKYNFSCHDIEIMLEDLKYNKTLHLLDLCNNNIGDHGMEHLADWLKTRPMLSGLLLAHNIITDHGARALSFGMPFSKIRMLDLSYNKITDSGAMDVFNSIKKSTLLRYLRLSGNSLGHCTAKIVERMLLSGVLVQENIDIKPYRVDHKWHIAQYPSDHYKQRYYDVPCYAFPQPLKIPYVKNKMSGKAAPKVNFKYVDPVPIEDRRYRINKDHPFNCICCECKDEIINSLASSNADINVEACVCGVCSYEADQRRPSTFHSEITLVSKPSCGCHFEDCACCYCLPCKGKNEDLPLPEREHHPINCNCCKCGAGELEYASSSISTKSNELHDYSDGVNKLQKIALILEKVDNEMQQHILKWINVTEETLNLDQATLNSEMAETDETEREGLSVCGGRNRSSKSLEIPVPESTCCKNDENTLCDEQGSYGASSCRDCISFSSSAMIAFSEKSCESNKYLNEII